MVVVLVDTLLVKIDNLHQVMDQVVVVAVIRLYNLAHPLLLHMDILVVLVLMVAAAEAAVPVVLDKMET
jgi:hypothetical protein